MAAGTDDEVLDWLGDGKEASRQHVVAPEHSLSPDSTKRCPYCAETIQTAAVKCKHCGELLDEGDRKQRKRESMHRLIAEHSSPNRGAAAAMSFLIPGLGQVYNGHIVFGLILGMVCVGLYMGWITIPFALALHVYLIVTAYRAAA